MPAKEVQQGEPQDKIHFVELLTVDIDGQPKGMTVPISPVTSVEPLLKGSTAVPSCGIDGSSIKGLAKITDSDLRLVPDIKTIRELPGVKPRRASVFTDVFQRGPDGKLRLHPMAPRTILHTIVDQLAAENLVIRVKMEPEFYYLTADGAPLDEAEYADLFPRNRAADLLLESTLDLRAVGIEPRWLHAEHGHGQKEIELDFTDISRAADNITLFKLILRRRAATHGLQVTFMPKPFANQAGSGLHCHLQLWQGEENLLGTADGTLTKQGLQFVAGLIEHVPAITAIANPSINSYKRLVPGYEAPVYIAWGYRNRSALIRVPLFTQPKEAAVEFRSPDSLSNPYLLLAALCAAGLDGIHRKLVPPEPVTEDLDHLSQSQLTKLKISQLPATLTAALQALQHDALLRQVLGEDLCSRYSELRAAEWFEYTHRRVTDFEWKEYLHR
jgi:glutamine synthetase